MPHFHTPGPWVLGDRTRKGRVKIDAPNWWGLASVVVRMADDNKDCADGTANARLIAAAPDLLDALQDVMAAHGEQLHDAFAKANAAIAKAIGQTQAEG